MGIANQRQYVLMTVRASSVHGMSSKKTFFTVAPQKGKDATPKGGKKGKNKGKDKGGHKGKGKGKGKDQKG